MGGGRRLHGGPKEAIMMAAYDEELESYICKKYTWINAVFRSVDWMGFQGYITTLDNVRQTNVIKLVHNWIHDGQKQDLFANQHHFSQCPVECDQIEYHQHYMSCYVPPIPTKNKKCVDKLTKTWRELKIATPIAKALKYIVTCVINDTETLQRRYPTTTTPFDTKVFQAWHEQKSIGWN